MAYLFLHHNRPLPRDRLAGTFWPGRPDAAARRALSQALWQIRRTLGPAADRLEAGQETVVLSLKEDDWIDVEAFRDLCTPRPSTSSLEEAHRLQEAIGLYRGDLLEAIYDDWALLERERLREIYLGALERLIILYKQWKEYGRALTYAQQLAAADPLREKAHRELMRLYHLVGRSQAALEQYSRLCELLDRELGIEPTSVTTALAREIANQANLAPSHLPMARAAPPVPLLEERVPIPLVGRREERALLLSYLDAAIGGHGGIVLVEGEAGVGKTRLLQEIAQDALWRGVQVLWGESVEGTPAYPYHPLVKALLVALSPLRVEQLAALVEEVWLCEVSRLIPQLSTWLPDLPPPTPLEPDQEQARFLEALARILRGLSQIAPYLLILEDLHWADEDTLTALAYLAPRLEQTRLLIIASHRQGQIREEPGRWQAFQALDRATGGRRLLLRRLNQEETTELVQRSLGLSTPAPIFGERIHRESEGNPLFILETLRTLYSEGLLYQDESGTWHTPWDETTTDYAEIPLPPTVEQVIWQRLTRLDDDAWTVLRGAAVLGQEATFRLLQSTTRLPQGRLLSALDELRRRYVLVETPAGYRFSHEKIRQVIYTGMDEESQRGLHQRAAYALEAAVPHQVVALAFHFEQGGVWAEALRYHRQAAEQATAAQAYAVAARHYERALALADRVDLPNEERFDLLGACETTMSVLGRRRDQMVCLERMARLAHNDPRRLAEVYHRRARMLVQTSRYSEAEEAAREAIRLAQEADDPLAEARARIAFGTALGIQGKRSPAIDHLQAAADIGRLLGDRRIEADAHALLSSLFLTANEHGPARLHAEAALGLYEAINYKRGVAGILGTLGRIDAMEGDLSQAEAYYQRSLKICRAIGYRQGEARNLLNWGLILVEQGRIGQALRLYQEALEAYRSVDDRRGEVLTLGNLADLCHHLLGDDDRAAQYAQAALRSCEAIRNPDRGYILLVLGCIACRRGEYEKARALLEEGLAAMRAVGKRRGEVDVHRALARLALIQGDPQAALEHLDQAETICRQTGLALPVAGLLAEKGVALLAQGQREAALAATKRAMARLQQGAEQGYLIPFAHYQVLTSLGQLEEARDAIEQAHRMLTEVLQSLSPEQREMSLERVPEHRAIVKAWQALQPRRLTFRLPRADAPTGRPLHDDEWVEVVWTVSVPDDDTIRGKVARRRHRLLRLLREAADQGAAPTVDHLAEALQVSPRTVKRDLAALRAAGHPTPTRGAREV
ncbi:MAG TPA: tetratricopeptide repeat protein [Thermoflexia bacterium]|nr:tetratricopeptide repeat protein [Thermoflexia bacterium]